MVLMMLMVLIVGVDVAVSVDFCSVDFVNY